MLSPELKQRILEATRHESSPTRAQWQARSAAWGLSALLVPLALFLALGGPRPGPRPEQLVLATGLGALATALILLGVALYRGPRLLGPARAWLVGVALLGPLLFLGWKLGLHAGLPNMTDPWMSRPGYRCFALTLALAAWPLAVLARLRRSSDPTHPRSLGLALGVAAGAGAAVLVDLWCPVGHLRHLAVGHVLPMGLLGLVGLIAGRRLLTPRVR
jgi:hypothetical protein